MTKIAPAAPAAPAPTNPAPAPAPAPAPTPGAFANFNLQWEARGMLKHNWTVSVSTTTKSGPVASVDTNGLFVRPNTSVGGDRFEQAAAREYTTMIAERVAALQSTFTSNLTAAQYAANKVEPGEFAIALTGAGDKPLYYTGLLKTAPQPMLDLIAGAQKLRDLLG